jgi:hypothetical protein
LLCEIFRVDKCIIAIGVVIDPSSVASFFVIVVVLFRISVLAYEISHWNRHPRRRIVAVGGDRAALSGGPEPGSCGNGDLSDTFRGHAESCGNLIETEPAPFGEIERARLVSNFAGDDAPGGRDVETEMMPTSVPRTGAGAVYALGAAPGAGRHFGELRGGGVGLIGEGLED